MAQEPRNGVPDDDVLVDDVPGQGGRTGASGTYLRPFVFFLQGSTAAFESPSELCCLCCLCCCCFCFFANEDTLVRVQLTEDRHVVYTTEYHVAPILPHCVARFYTSDGLLL